MKDDSLDSRVCRDTEPNSLPIFSTMDASRAGKCRNALRMWKKEKETNVTGSTQHKVPGL